MRILNSIPALISKVFPIPGRFRGALPSDIAQLSKLLTNNRGERSLSYLGQPKFLSAYLYYFMPWNLYRLCLLLPELDIKLSPGDTITDLGCGPLTFTSALWIARPELRAIPLEFNCADRIMPVMEAGKKFFTALNEENSGGTDTPWKINLIKKDINLQKGGLRLGSASLVCSVNMFNEMYDRIPHSNTGELKTLAANAARLMFDEAAKDSPILTVEPGVPQSGRFISFLRDAFIELGCPPAAPCTHVAPCPFAPQRQQSGASLKQKWCHFNFEAGDAPKDLQRLSVEARLPKERAAFSFLLTGAQKNKNNIRIISDAFPLPRGRFGRYGCSNQGLILLAGEKKQIESLDALSLVEQDASSDNNENGERDEKSGALIMELI